ncbi:MAG: TRAP transporter small permease [Beijerinckiaceae bacterium]
MSRFIIRLSDIVTDFAKFVLGSCIAAIVLVTLAAVFWRYVLENPISWIEQVSNMIFIWVVFIGSAVLYRQNLHIGVDVFLHMLSEKNRAIWKWVVECGNLLFIVVLFIYSLKLTIDVLPNTAGALDISPAYYYASAPVACLMMMLYFIEKVVDPTKRLPFGEAGEF